MHLHLEEDADAKTLSQIVGNKEAVIQTSDLETFKKMIKVVSASSVLTNSGISSTRTRYIKC